MNVVTWNMRGLSAGRSRWHTGVRSLFQGGASVVCLQECGVPPSDAIPAAPPPWGTSVEEPGARYLLWSIGSPAAPLHVLIFWLGTDQDGRRVDLAVATLFAPVATHCPESTRAPSHLLCVPNPAEGGRPAIGLRLPYNGACLDIYSLHALAPDGPDGPKLLTSIHATDASAPWFAAGDFNRGPDDWSGLPVDMAHCPHNGDVLNPGGHTRSSYAFISPAPGVQGGVLNCLMESGHYPIVYVL